MRSTQMRSAPCPDPSARALDATETTGRLILLAGEASRAAIEDRGLGAAHPGGPGGS